MAPAKTRSARQVNPEVTGFHVILPFHVFTIQTEMLEDTKKQYECEYTKIPVLVFR